MEKVEKAEKPKGKKKKIIIIVLAVIGFLIIGGIFGVNLFIGTDKFKDMLTSKMEDQLHAKVNMDEWDASVFSGIKFTNLSVDQPEGFGSGKLLQTTLFTVQFDFWDLIKKKITLSEIIIDDLTANLNQNKEGLWFFQTLSKQDGTEDATKTAETDEKTSEESETQLPDAGMSNLFLMAETLRIKNANFTAKDKDGNVIGELKNGNINGKINIQGSKNDIVMNLESSSISVAKEISGLDDNITVKDLKISLKLDENEIQLKNMSLGIFDGDLKMKMLAKNYQSDKLNMDIELQVNNLNAGPILDIVGQPRDMLASPITLELSTKLDINSVAPLKNFIESSEKSMSLLNADKSTLPIVSELLDNITNIETNISLGKIHAKDIAGIKDLVIDKIKIPIQIKRRSLALNGIEVDMFGGTFKISLNTDIEPDSLGIKVDIETKGIKAAPLLAIAGVEDDMVKGDLNAHITFESAIKDPLPFNPKTIDTSNVKGSISVGGIDTKPAGKIDSLQLFYNIINGKVKIDPLAIKAYDGTIKVVMEADHLQSEKPIFDADIAIENLNCTKLLKSIGEDPELASGNLNLKLLAKGSGNSLENLNLDSNMEVGKITVMKDFVVDKITLPMNLKNGVLNIKPLIEAFKGEIKTDLTASNVTNLDPKSRDPLPTFILKTSLSNIDSAPIMKYVELEEMGIVSGPLNVDLSSTGSGNSLENLTADMTLTMPSMRADIANTVVENVNGKIHFANQIAIINEFTADVYDGSISMQGSYDLPRETYDANVNMQSLSLANALEGVVKDIPQIKRFLDVTKVMTGTAEGNAKVTGNIVNFDLLKGTFDLKVKDGVVGGHPIQTRLADILDKPELANIAFSYIDTVGSIDGMLVNLDDFELNSKSIVFLANNGKVDINNDSILLPVEIGLSSKIAAKLEKPVKEIRYGLKQKEDGMHYLPPFEITGSLSKPNIKKAMVEVLAKSAAKGFAKKEILKVLGKELEDLNVVKESSEETNSVAVKESTKTDSADNSKEKKDEGTVDKVKGMIDGVFKSIFKK